MRYKIGDKASTNKTFTAAEVNQFAELSGDKNPVHLDEQFAATTIFKQRIVHGAFVSSLISSVLGNQLPGPGSIYLGQTLNFKRPVHLNDTVTATVEIFEVNEAKSIYKLNTVCSNQNGEVVIDGVAVIKL